MKAVLDALGERARAILKALSTEKEDDASNPPVPNAPPDPDALPADPRIAGADASPDEKDLDKAGDDQSHAAPAPGAEGEGDGPPPTGGEPGGDEDEEKDADGRPITKGFDEFGNADLAPDEMREMLKSYGVTPATDEDKIANGGTDVESVLEAILQGFERQNSVISELQKEVKSLRASHAENERSIAKALDSLADPRTAPAAPPRAITKALPVGVVPPSDALTEAQFATRVFSDIQAKRITPDEGRAQVREYKVTPR